MNTPLNVVAVSGSTFLPSRTLVLTQAIVAELGQHLRIQSQVIELGDIARPLGAALSRKELPPAVEQKLRAVEQADLLVAASPVYRGTYPGQFKHLFDLIGQDALIGKPVLLAATGGSERHALMLEHQLRPLFSFFQAFTAPVGIYASEADFSNYRISSEALQARIALAVQRVLPLLGVQGERLSEAA
jgi:FMN reductase